MKVSARKKSSNKNVIAKKPLTNLYEINSTLLLWRMILKFNIGDKTVALLNMVHIMILVHVIIMNNN